MLENQLYHSARIQSLSDTAGSMSSSFRNSLNAIDSQCEQLIEAYGDEGKVRVLRIQEISQRARTIQKQLDSIHVKPHETRKRTTSVSASLERAIKACIPLLPPKITIDGSGVSSKEVMVNCTPIELEQLVVNLILNARDAISQNEGTISVSVQLQQGNVIISVSDTGSGIPVQHIEHIFDPFYTTKIGTKRNGFGLASVKRTTNKLKGNVIAQNIVNGEGARFVVTLPVD